ncbi:MAG: tautomerase family protein [Alphaproteobacteria bacterium]
MPVIHINHRAGLSKAQKRRLSEEITDVFVKELNKDPELVEIFWHDIADHDFAKGGKLLEDILKEEKMNKGKK